MVNLENLISCRMNNSKSRESGSRYIAVYSDSCRSTVNVGRPRNIVLEVVVLVLLVTGICRVILSKSPQSRQCRPVPKLSDPCAKSSFHSTMDLFLTVEEEEVYEGGIWVMTGNGIV